MEEWRPIEGHPKFEISSIGRCRRIGPMRASHMNRIIPPSISKKGYRTFHVWDKNKRRVISAHRAVAIAFIGPPPFPKAQAAHEDGDPGNNTPGNLKWKTNKQNQHDRWRHGTMNLGENHPQAKLTVELVLQMRAMRKRGWGYKEIAEICGTTLTCAYHAITGRHWGWLK